MGIAYPELVSAMAKRRITRKSVAGELELSPRTLYDKIMGKSEFTFSEANKIHSEFFPDLDIVTLFSKSE